MTLHTLLRYAAAALLLAFSSAGLAGDQDFTVENQTGVEIHKLFVSPHSADDWQDDVLGQDTLADGDSVEIQFSPQEQAAHWDLRIEDSEGASIEWESLDLLAISAVTLHFKDGKAWADVE